MGVGSLGWTRRFTYDRSTVVGLCLAGMQRTNPLFRDSGTSVYVPQKAISVRTGEKELVFGTMIKNEAKQFIAAAIVMRATQGR